MVSLQQPTFTAAYRWVTTLVIYFCFFAYGICVNMFSPTWMDLNMQIGTTMEKMSFSVSLRSGCFSVGAIIGGFLFTYCNRQVFYSLFMFITGICTICISLTSDYVVFLVLNSVFGLFTGASDTAVSVWMLDMWQKRSGPFMQALQFFWAVGLIVAPLLSRPFLSDVGEVFNEHHSFISEDELDMQDVDLADIEMLNNATHEHVPYESHLYIPYGVCGSLLACGASVLLGLYVYQQKIARKESTSAEKEPEKAELNTEKEKMSVCEKEEQQEQQPPKAYIVLMVGLSCVLVAFFCAAEMTTLHYLPTFVAHLDLGLSKLTGPLVLSACAGSFTIGRLSGIGLAIFIKPEHILFIDWIFMCIGNMILLFSNSSEFMLWTGAIVIGFGFAAFFPAVFSFLKNRLDVTNMISAMLLLSSLAANALGFPVIVGKYIETMPLVMAHANFICLAIIGVVFIGLMLTEVHYRPQLRKMSVVSRCRKESMITKCRKASVISKA